MPQRHNTTTQAADAEPEQSYGLLFQNVKEDDTDWAEQRQLEDAPRLRVPRLTARYPRPDGHSCSAWPTSQGSAAQPRRCD